jgi:hypothetical protein
MTCFRHDIRWALALAAVAVTSPLAHAASVRLGTPPQGFASALPSRSLDGAVYDTVLRTLFRGTGSQRLVVEATALAFPSLSNADWQGVFRDAPQTLRTQLEAAAANGPVALDPQALPVGTQLVPRADIDRLFREAPRGPGLEYGWRPFRERWGVVGWQALSRPVITDDGRDALVYYENHCGAICGEGAMAWLHRDSAADPWAIKQVRPFWTS